MEFDKWLDVKTLQGLSKHTSAVAGALLSYLLIARLVEWALGPGFLAGILDDVDKVVLVALFLLFIFKMGYYFYREIKDSGNSHFLVVC